MDNNRQYMNIDDALDACVKIQKAWRKSHHIAYRVPVKYEPITDIEIQLLAKILIIMMIYIQFSFGCFLVYTTPRSNIQLQINY